MFIPKKYGQSKIDKCPFCVRHAVTVNKQGVPVCSQHKDCLLENLKCVCGSMLDIMQGKFGVFFKCLSCGPINLRKVLELNEIRIAPKITEEEYKENKIKKEPLKTSKNNQKKEITVRSDDPRYFD